MTEIFLYHNGKIIENYTGVNTEKAIQLLINGTKLEVLLNTDKECYKFEVKLTPGNWKLKWLREKEREVRMSEIYLYYNGKLLDTFTTGCFEKCITLLNKSVKFEVILNNESDRFVFNAKLDPNYKFISSDNIDREWSFET